MNIATRIRQKRIELGISQPKLAKLCGWKNYARISHYEMNRRTPEASDVEIIAKALNVSPSWLQFGIPPLQSASAYLSMATPLKPVGKIPVLNWEEILRFKFDGKRYHMDMTVMDNTNRQYEVVYEKYPPNSFALPVEGDSMTSSTPFTMSFKEGMMLYIDPDRDAQSTNYVLCTFNHGKEAAFRQYVIDSGVHYLKPLNPQYPLERVDNSTAIIGVVIEYKGKLV